MKKLVYLAIAMLLPGSLLAEPIKKDAAKAKAAAFLQQKMTATNGRRAPQNLSLESNEPEGAAYYVFKNGTKGFAIVAGDDRFGDVIGYSEEGTLNEANMPEALRLTLQDYAAAVKFAQENNIEVKKAPRKAERANVSPFVKYKWDQGTPYSDMCPADGSKEHCSTGCMAVSLATIIAHFQYPKTLPACYGYLSSDHSDAYSYDYSAFKTTYTSSYNAGELPQFMYHVANLLGTHFEASGSGAQLSKMVPTLKSLGYNQSIRAIRRDAYSAEDWNEIIYSEVAAGRPVNFMGEHTDLGGHSYICDGYQSSTGFYHILWGWGTTCEGYFDINILNPFIEYISQWGRLGYNCPPAGFTGGLQAVIGIQKENASNTAVDVLTTDELASMSGNSFRATIYNLNDNKYYGQLTWAVLGENGDFNVIDNLTPQTVRSQNYSTNGLSYNDWGYATINVNSLSFADGIYKIVPVCKTSDEGAEWALCEGYRQKYVEVTVKNGEANGVAHPVFNVVVDNIVYKGASGSYLELILSLRNAGDDTYGFLNLSARRDDGVSVNGSKMDIAVRSGETQRLSVFIETGGSSSGHTYDVNVQYLKKNLGTFTINPKLDPPSANAFTYKSAEFEDYEVLNDEGYLYSTTLKGDLLVNCSSYEYYGPVKITLKDENENVVYSQTTIQYFIERNETKRYPVEVIDLQAGKKYYLTAQLTDISRSGSTYSESVKKTFFTDFPINVTVGVPYYTQDGKLDRKVIAGSDKVDLPANSAAVDFRTFSSDLVNLSSIKNENCLYIFPAGATVPAELSGKNVVVGGVAETITLADGKPVVFPVDFTATEITYARTFTNYNNGGTGGWNTIVLPFEATPTLDGTNIDWFHSKSDASGRKFWLYKYTNGVGGTVYFDYASERKMQANVPYLLAVPGDKWGEKYDLHNKKFVFRGENAAVKANVEPATKSGEYVFNGTFAVADCKNAYKLNEDGDFFELQTEDANEQPFRAYFANADESTSNAARVLRVARSETDGIVNMENVDMTTENEPVYNLNGQRMQQLQRGVNIVGGKKILKK